MFITPAFAQGTAADPTGGIIGALLPLVLIFIIFWFLIIRPQQRRIKEHREMVSNLRRGDTVVTGGGLIGKVVKVIDDVDVQVEIAEGVKVRIARAMIAELRNRSEPVNDNSDA